MSYGIPVSRLNRINDPSPGVYTDITFPEILIKNFVIVTAQDGCQGREFKNWYEINDGQAKNLRPLPWLSGYRPATPAETYLALEAMATLRND
jgi:hypothetical protein